MLFGFRISVLFCHPKVDNVNDIGKFSVRPTKQEIVWLDIAVDEVLFVNCLDPRELIDIRRALSREFILIPFVLLPSLPS